MEINFLFFPMRTETPVSHRHSTHTVDIITILPPFTWRKQVFGELGKSYGLPKRFAEVQENGS